MKNLVKYTTLTAGLLLAATSLAQYTHAISRLHVINPTDKQMAVWVDNNGDGRRLNPGVPAGDTRSVDFINYGGVPVFDAFRNYKRYATIVDGITSTPLCTVEKTILVWADPSTFTLLMKSDSDNPVRMPPRALEIQTKLTPQNGASCEIVKNYVSQGAHSGSDIGNVHVRVTRS